MLNVIKMDLLRMFKSKVFFVTIVVMVAFMILNVYMVGVTIKDVAGNPQEIQTESSANEEGVGMSFDMDYSNINYPSLMVSIFGTCFLMITTGIFAVIFTVNESVTGFIKNIVSTVKYRWMLTFSKSIIMAFYVLIEFAVFLIISYLCTRIFIPTCKFEISNGFLKMIGLQYLLHLAFAELIVMISTLSKSKVIGIIFAICSACGLVSILISSINKLITNSDFLISKYLLFDNIKKLTPNPENTTSFNIIWLCVGSFVLYNILSGLLIQKRDIR